MCKRGKLRVKKVCAQLTNPHDHLPHQLGLILKKKLSPPCWPPCRPHYRSPRPPLCWPQCRLDALWGVRDAAWEWKSESITDGRTNLRTGMLYLISWNPLLVKIIAPKKWLILHSANQSSAKKRWLVHFTCGDVYVLKRSSGGRVCLIIKFSLIIFDRSILSPSFSSLLEETLTACSKIE